MSPTRAHLTDSKTRHSAEPGGACSLDRVPDSTAAQVLAVKSDHGAEKQLAKLGIHAGAKLRVKRAAPLGGPVLVEVDGSMVAIGRNLARKVMVKMQ